MLRLTRATFEWSQENDGCDNETLGQSIEVEIVDGGGGPYFVLKTQRWAIDSITEMIALLDCVGPIMQRIKDEADHD